MTHRNLQVQDNVEFKFWGTGASRCLVINALDTTSGECLFEMCFSASLFGFLSKALSEAALKCEWEPTDYDSLDVSSDDDEPDTFFVDVHIHHVQYGVESCGKSNKRVRLFQYDHGTYAAVVLSPALSRKLQDLLNCETPYDSMKHTQPLERLLDSTDIPECPFVDDKGTQRSNHSRGLSVDVKASQCGGPPVLFRMHVPKVAFDAIDELMEKFGELDLWPTESTMFTILRDRQNYLHISVIGPGNGEADTNVVSKEFGRRLSLWREQYNVPRKPVILENECSRSSNERLTGCVVLFRES